MKALRFGDPSCDEVRHATVLRSAIWWGGNPIKKCSILNGQLAFQRGIERVVTEVARSHGAHIETFEGDGALVVFGFPPPREDRRRSPPCEWALKWSRL